MPVFSGFRWWLLGVTAPLCLVSIVPCHFPSVLAWESFPSSCKGTNQSGVRIHPNPFLAHGITSVETLFPNTRHTQRFLMALGWGKQNLFHHKESRQP